MDTIGYTRVSSEEQAADRKTSLADQRTAITALAGQLNRTVGQVFEDAGVSGSKETRPALAELMRFCEAHPRPDGLILVLNESRWGRFDNPEDSAFFRRKLERATGWRIRFVEGDAEDPTARTLLRAIGAATASQYRATLRANTRRGARGTAAKGLWQNEAPFGYRRCAQGPSGFRVLEVGQRKAEDEQSRLVLGPEPEVQLVREIFKRYAAGLGASRDLVAELKTRWPVKRWSRGVLGALLRNPVYTGDVVWCRTSWTDDGIRQRHVPPESWVLVRDAHPAIVSRDLFAAAQARMVTRKREGRSAVGRYPLSGLVTCAACGKPYTGGGGKLGTLADPDRYRFYKDAGGSEGPEKVCPGPLGTVNGRWLESKVVDVVAGALRGPLVRRLIAAEVDRQVGRAGERVQTLRADLDRRHAQLVTEQARLVAAVARGTLTDAEAGAHLAEQREQIAGLKAELERSRFSARGTSISTTERERLITLALDFRAVAGQASGQQLRELLRPWLAGAVLDKANRKLILTIRRIPAVTPFTDLAIQPGRSGQKCDSRLVVRRVIALPRKRRVA